MRRLGLFFGCILVLILTGVALAAQGQANRPASAPRLPNAASARSSLPDATCTFIPLSFNLNGTGPVEALRPFTTTAGDSFVQFVGAPLAPPVTATNTSSAYVLVNNSFTGTLSGGITGTFAMTNLNSLLITNPAPPSNPRGFQLNEIVLTGASGTITCVLAIDLNSKGTVPPYYPNFITGYLHSKATSGAYAPYKFAGYITFGITTQFGGTVTLFANITGRLYTGGGTLNEVILATRDAPPNRPAALQPTDMIAQFIQPDFAAGSTSGHVNPRTTFTGTIGGTINGGFLMDHNALLVDSGPNAGKGWLVGNFNFLDTGGDFLTGPWLSDLAPNPPFGTSVNGYLFQAFGTGVYTDSMLFGTISGNLSSGGTNFLGTMSGVYCEGSTLPSPTPQPTQAGTSTSTATQPPAATGTAQATQTAAPTSTQPPAATSTAPSTSTAPIIASPTSTAPIIASPTSTAQPSLTPTVAGATPPTISPQPGTATSTPIPPTPCTITFTDVPSTDVFYPFIRCLACRGIISGYADGTFRPGNDVTRGQLSKIVSNSAGFQETIPDSQQTFTDVPHSNPFWVWIERIADRGIITGYPCGGPLEPCDAQNRPYFRWGANATRGQISKIVSEAKGFNDEVPPDQQTFTDVPNTNTFWLWIERLAKRGIMSGYQCGRPGEPCDPQGRAYFRWYNNATRGQTAKIVANTFFPNCQTPARR
jgi:hypothetical protein